MLVHPPSPHTLHIDFLKQPVTAGTCGWWIITKVIAYGAMYWHTLKAKDVCVSCKPDYHIFYQF
jgi:hypothetical protein